LKDLTLVRNHLLKTGELTGLAFVAADTSGDGKIALKDLTLIRGHLLKTKPLF
jgi:hypothetical protein